MEPLTKNEKYSYSFYRRMIENIKQTKDKQNPDDDTFNYVRPLPSIKVNTMGQNCWVIGSFKCIGVHNTEICSFRKQK